MLACAVDAGEHFMWYGDNSLNPDSYGKFIAIPTDNGMRMEIEIITT